MRQFLILVICLISITTFSQQMPDKDIDLLNAAAKGDEIALLRALRDSANVNATNEDGVTALMYASQNGYLDIVKILIYNKAMVNASPRNGITALISAAIYDKLEVLEYLVRSGADVNAKDSNGVSALLYASAYGYYRIVDLLYFQGADIYTNAPDGISPIIVAAFYGYLDVVTLLLNRGVDVNSSDFYGWTPLLVSVQSNNFDMLRLLMSKNANINKCNNTGLTALAIAVQNNNRAMVDTLIKYGADVNGLLLDTLNTVKASYRISDRNMAGFIKKKGVKVDNANWDISLISLSANITDFMTGADVRKNNNHLSLFAGFQTRLFANRVLTPYSDNFLMQKWERRALFYMGAGYAVNLWSQQHVNIDFSPYIKGLYSYGAYRATTTKPSKLYTFVPGFSIDYSYKRVFVKVGYEYLNLRVDEFSPHRLTLIIGFKIKHKIKKQIKEIDWI